MRVLMKVQIPVEAGNAGIANGELPKAIQGFAQAAKPEAMYFTTLDGKRTMLAVFDLASTQDIPSIGEPFFAAVNASVDLTPCMDLTELQAALGGL